MIKTILILMLVPLVATGTYYISPSGSDYDNGTSWETAWLTIDHVNQNLQAGDTIFFASGTWYDSQILPPQGGDPSHQTVYACSTFSLDSKHLAKIYGADIVTGWTQTTSHVYEKQWVGNGCYEYGCGSLVQDLEPLQMIDPGYTSLSAGRYYYDDGYIYVWCYDDKNPNNCQMLASCKPPVYFRTYNPDIAYVKFWGLDFRYGQQATVYFNARTNHISIEHCAIGSSGHTSANACGVFASANDGGKNAYDSTTHGHYNNVTACEIGNLLSLLTSWCTIGTGDGIILYSEQFFVVDSNYFFAPIGTGINFKGKQNGTTLTGMVAKYNLIVGARRQGIDIWKHPYKDSIYGNTILWSTRHGITIETGSEPWEADIVIANNTIYNSGDRGICIWDENSAGDCNYGFDVFGNIVDVAFVGMAFDYFPTTECEDSSWVDYNLYHFIDRGNESSCGWTWASWQVCGFDSNGVWGVDPKFNDTSNLDFSRPTAEQEVDYYIGDWHCVNRGAWQGEYGEPSWICGDANGNGFIDIDDPLYLLAYIFSDGPAPDPIISGDANGNGTDIPIDIDDVVYLLDYIFNSGSEPICEGL